MPDYNGISEEQALPALIDRRMASMRVCLPGLILAFDPAAQTVTAQPSIKMKITVDSPEYMELPPILNVPLVIPYAQGKGLLLTLPIQPGDECLLIFADRSIDNVAEHGGIQPSNIVSEEATATPRAHHLTDAICIPGFISRPQAVPAYNTENIELRDRERTNYISLGPSGITITDGTATWTMSGGAVTLDAPAGLTETSQAAMTRTTPATQTITGSNVQIGSGGNTLTGTLHATGTITTDADVSNGASTTLGTHTHSGIMPGGSNTDQPNPGS